MNGLVLKTSKFCGTSHNLKKSYFNFIVSRSVRNNRFNNMKLMVNSGDLMEEYAEAAQQFNQEPKSQRFDQEPKSQRLDQEPKSQRFNQEPKSQQFKQEPKSQRFDQEPKSQRFNQEPKSQRFNQEPKSQRFNQEPKSQRFNQEPKSHRFDQEPKSQRFNQEPKSQRFDQEPKSHRFNQEPKSQRFNQEPKSQRFDKEPKSHRFNQEPKSQQFKQEPKSQRFNQEPKSQRFDQEPKSQQFKQEPKSRRFNQEPKSQRFNQEPQSTNQFQTEEEPFEFPKVKKNPKLVNNIDERIGNIANLLDFPSDSKRFVQKVQELRDEDKPAHKQPYQPKKKIDPSMRTVLLFPGQGSQFVGMGKKLLQFPKTKEMFNIASNILGYDLLKVCMEGPKEVLNKTQNCQAAVVVSSLAAVEKMRHETPWAINNCAVTAGYSVGEISALVLAEALSFEDAIALVKVRADNMQNICNSVPSGMMSVAINKDSKYKFACHSAVLFCKQELKMDDPVCEVTNHLHSHLKVISGNNEALEFIARNAESFNLGKCVYLPVSGAFHSTLMRPAAIPILDTLKTLKIKKPAIQVYSNVTGCKYKNENDVQELMAKHVWKPVKWEQIMTDIYSRNRGDKFPFTYEVGPGKQLGYLLVKNNGQAFKEYTSIDV